MQGYNREENRLIWKTSDLSGGMDSHQPARALDFNTFTRLEGAHVVGGKGIPGAYQAAEGTRSAPEIVHRAFRFTGTPPSLVFCAMTKAYALSDPTPEFYWSDLEISPSPRFTDLGTTGIATHHLWSGGSLQDGTGHKLVVCNGIDKLHYWDGSGVFQVISGAPYMKYAAPGIGRVVGCNVRHGGRWLANRIQWSTEGNCLDWSASVTWGFLDLPDEEDKCVALGFARTQFGYAFRKRCVYLLLTTQKGENPITAQPLFRKGIRAQNSVQRLPDDSFVYLGYDDVYRVTPEGGNSIGGPIRDELYASTTLAKAVYAWSWHDAYSNRYYIVLPEISGHGRTAWCYNYEEDHWTKHRLGYCTLLTRWYGESSDYEVISPY